MLDKLRKLRADHLRIQHDLVFYPYQELVSDKIFEALLQNLRLTQGATEEDIKKLKLVEIPIEFSRQSGKTTAVVYTVEFILTWLSVYFERQIHIGIFAPQIEQARTDFDRLKVALRRIKDMIVVDEETERIIKEQENAKTLVLPDGSSCYIAPVTKTSRPESKTLDLMIFEEAQDLDDKIVQESIWPIGASTNAPRIYLGTAGTRICHFYRLGQSSSIKLYYPEIIKQRRETYKATGDAKHLIYEQTVAQEIELRGLESDEIQRPYFGKWLIGTGQFVTAKELDKLYTDRKRTQRYYNTKTPLGYCYAGIDTAKHPDSTVVTILRDNIKLGKREILYWMELRGENYQDQFDIIVALLSNYSIEAVAIDSTAQGAFMPDLFERNTQWRDEHSGLYRVAFSAQSKSALYENLKNVIKQLLTTLPEIDKTYGARFRQQMLDLQQEWKGQLLSVKHPDDPNAHDDYCWVAGTQILTEHGNRNIEKIQVGDLVVTRKGLKPVVAIGNRQAEVITRFGLIGTPDHPFITTKGVKRFDSLAVGDIIHVWNEKLSSIEVRSITAILNQIGDSSEYIIGDMINGKNHQSPYTGKFGQITSVLFRRAMLSITERATRLTIPLAISNVSQEASINHDINLRQKLNSEPNSTSTNMLGQKLKLGTVLQRGWSGIVNMLTKVSSSTKNYQTVYNLTVVDEPEYFANNILVHNCDSWALAEWAYAQRHKTQVEVSVVDITNEPDRKITRDDKGKVIDFWPGD